MEVKDILRNRRLEMGYTMKQLAAMVGVSEGTISRWESGDIAEMKRSKIYALSIALNLTPNTIMEWPEDTKDKQFGRLERCYTALNEEGQEKLIDYAEMLVQSGKHKKQSDTISLGKEA